MENEILELLHGYKQEIPSDSSADILDSGIIDSFDMVNIVSLLESRFHISVDAEDILPENFQSIDCISKLVERYVNTK